MKISLGAEGRRRLRSAIVSHASYRGGLNMAEATKEELLATATSLGIDVTQFALGGVRREVPRVRPPIPAPAAAPQLDAVPAAVTGQVVAMARAAVKPASAPVTAQKQPKKQPTKVGSKSLKELFGVAVKNGDGTLATLDVYDGTEAPAVDPRYRWGGREEALHWVAVAEASGMPLWLAGPPGTGKTSFVKQVAAKLGRPFVRVNFDSGIERYELLGGERVRGGDVLWQDGILTQAIQTPGCVILLDEPGFGRPEYMSAMHPILEEGGALTITETGEVIEKAPGVIIIAADNSTGTAESAMAFNGVREQNQAMIDRYVGTVMFNYLPADEEAALLADTVKGMPLDAAKYLIDSVGKMRTAAAGGVLSTPPSWRRIVSWGWSLVKGVKPDAAFLSAIATRQDSLSNAALMKIYSDSVNAKVLAQLLKGKPLEEAVQSIATAKSDDEEPAF